MGKVAESLENLSPHLILSMGATARLYPQSLLKIELPDASPCPFSKWLLSHFPDQEVRHLSAICYLYMPKFRSQYFSSKS